MYTYLPINPDAGNERDVIRIGGGSQVIEVRALAVNELTRDELEVLLHITDRRENRDARGKYEALPREYVLKPLGETDAPYVHDKFGVELETHLTPQTELYTIQHSHQLPRDTVLKFVGHTPRDVKISLDREQRDPWDPKFFMSAHPSVPVNNAGRWAALHHGNVRKQSVRDTYEEWLRLIGEAPVALS